MTRAESATSAELDAMRGIARTLAPMPSASRARVLRYICARYMPSPTIMIHDDDSDQDECAPWPSALSVADGTRAPEHITVRPPLEANRDKNND